MAKKQFVDEDGKTYVAKEKKPFYKKWWFWLIVIIVVISLFGDDKNTDTVNNSTDQPKTTETATKEQPKEEPYVLSNVEATSDGYNYYVEGVLKNNTDKDKSYVQIQFPAKDKDGNKIGDALDNVNNLNAGETWKFKAILFEQSDEEPTFDLENPVVEGF